MNTRFNRVNAITYYRRNPINRRSKITDAIAQTLNVISFLITVLFFLISFYLTFLALMMAEAIISNEIGYSILESPVDYRHTKVAVETYEKMKIAQPFCIKMMQEIETKYSKNISEEMQELEAKYSKEIFAEMDLYQLVSLKKKLEEMNPEQFLETLQGGPTELYSKIVDIENLYLTCAELIEAYIELNSEHNLGQGIKVLLFQMSLTQLRCELTTNICTQFNKRTLLEYLIS